MLGTTSMRRNDGVAFMSPTADPPPGPVTAARSSTALPATAHLEAQVAFEQVAQLYSVTASRMLVSLAYLAVVVLALWPQRQGPALVAWALALTAVSIWRVGETGRFRREPNPVARTGYWRARYLFWMTLYALGWAWMIVGFASPDGGLVLTLMLGGALGIASVAVYTTFSLAAASLCFLAALLGPVVLWFALHGGAGGWGIAAGAALYGCVLALEAVRGERRITEMIRLRLSNAAIAEERSRALLLAEQASRTKSRFLAAVSHEMRTPLNGIMGLAESLRDRAQDATSRHEAGVLLASAQHLHGVIADLLDLSRLEFGRLRVQRAPADPARLLHEVAALHAPVAADKGLTLRVAAPATLPARLIDTLRVQQVLHNLLSNAVKFTAEGEVEAMLAVDGDELLYTVRDTGPGVPAARADAIFEPFEQVAPQQADQGTGLGLTIARRLARAMGGDVSCRAAAPRGAVFSFAVNAALAPEPAPAAPADLQTAPALQGRVLVVDDNAVNALVAQTMLTRLGLASDTARDGEEALARMAAQRYSAVLMDCRMPVLDGLEATRRWRAGEQGQGGRLPIIGVTANVSAEDRRACHEAGMDGFLAKPFLVEELRRVLHAHLGPGGAQPENAPS